MIEKVLSRASKLFTAHIIVIGMNAGAHFLLAKWLAPQIYGSIFFLITVLNFIIMTGMLGFQHIIMHQMPRLSAQKDNDSRIELLHDCWSVTTALGLGSSLVAVGWHFLINPLPVVNSDGAVLSLLLIAPLSVLIKIGLTFLLSSGRTFSGVLPDQGLQAVGLIIAPTIILLYLPDLMAKTSFLFSGLIAATIAGAVFVALYIHKIFPHNIGYSFRFFAPLKKWQNLNIPFFVFSLAQMAVQRFDLILIGFLLGPIQVAIYGVALKVSQILNFPAMASKAALAPRFSMLFEAKNYSDMRGLLLISSAALAFIGIISGVILYFLSPYILNFLENVYAVEALKIILIMLVTETIICALTPSKINALMGTAQTFLSQIFLAGFVLSFLLNLYFIPQFGIEAAAIIRFLTMSLIHIFIAAYGYKKLNL